jgi:short-subunit dehydrogenase
MLKHIFITGASQGIGMALAVRLANTGVTLTLLARNKEKLNEVKKLCADKGALVDIYAEDICEYSKIQKIIIESDKKQNIDLMILSAGITSTATVDHFEKWNLVDKLLQTNLMSPIASANTVLPIMQKRKKGHVVFISSLAAYSPMAHTPAYCASKSGIKSYAESVRQYYKKDNIYITIVCPGFIKTNMSTEFLCPKPFMNTTEKATEIIIKGIHKKRGYINFPVLLYIYLKLQHLLPYKLSDFITKLAGYGRK